MKILIVRVGRLGDIVMILPALAEIKRLYPKADIYALTSPDGVRLLKAYGIRAENIHAYSNHLYKRPTEQRKVKQFMQNHHFGKIFCFEQKKRTVSWLPANTMVLDNSLIDAHYALRCLKMVNPEAETSMSNPYLAAGNMNIDEQLAQYQITPETLLVGFHPTYSGFTKWGRKEEKKHRLWPEQSFAQLSDALWDFGQQQGLDIRVMMDLLPEECVIAKRILAQCKHPFILRCEAPDFQRYLAYIDRLNVLVAPNTGVMHLAAALNTPTVALFSGAEPGDCGPYMSDDNARVLRSDVFSQAESGMKDIPVQPVFESVQALLHLDQ